MILEQFPSFSGIRLTCHRQNSEVHAKLHSKPRASRGVEGGHICLCLATQELCDFAHRSSGWRSSTHSCYRMTKLWRWNTSTSSSSARKHRQSRRPFPRSYISPCVLCVCSALFPKPSHLCIAKRWWTSTAAGGSPLIRARGGTGLERASPAACLPALVAAPARYRTAVALVGTLSGAQEDEEEAEDRYVSEGVAFFNYLLCVVR